MNGWIRHGETHATDEYSLPDALPKVDDRSKADRENGLCIKMANSLQARSYRLTLIIVPSTAVQVWKKKILTTSLSCARSTLLVGLVWEITGIASTLV